MMTNVMYWWLCLDLALVLVLSVWSAANNRGGKDSAALCCFAVLFVLVLFLPPSLWFVIHYWSAA
jgi:hypothetical protein